MELVVNAEFRGCSVRADDKGNEYHYVNIEDENGESAKFQIDLALDIKQFKKGDKVKACLDYNVKYGSLKVVRLSKGV